MEVLNYLERLKLQFLLFTNNNVFKDLWSILYSH